MRLLDTSGDETGGTGEISTLLKMIFRDFNCAFSGGGVTTNDPKTSFHKILIRLGDLLLLSQHPIN